MAEDWSIDVKKYVPNADDGAIAGIVRYCGIALRNRDSSLVSFTDSTETGRVRENYLKKKLALTDPDEVLDSAITAVGVRMKEDTTRNRVTVYYLLAEHFGKLGLFGGGAAAVSSDAAPAAAPVAAAAAAPVVAAAAAVPLMAMSAAKKDKPAATGATGSGYAEYLPIALLLLVGLGVGSMIVGKKQEVAAVAPVAVVAAPQAIPTGAGITEAVVEGEPMVSVYFDTAKFDVDPSFEARTAAVRLWLVEHPGTHLQLSGFNDPRGDAAQNAELSKNRAFAVRDRLVALGVPATAMDLVKPAEATDTTESLEGARRVDITVEDGPVAAGEAAVEPAPAAVAAAAAPAS